MQILKPTKVSMTPKSIIAPNNLFVTLDDLKRKKEIRPEDIALDLHATIAVSKNGRIQGKETFRCNSFVKNWMDMMRALMLHSDVDIYSAYDGVAYELEAQSGSNLGVVFSNPYGYWAGPLIGTGTTSPAANDKRMEQQVTHGTTAPNASEETGTTHATQSSTIRVVDDGNNSFSTDQYNYHILEITSGALNGEERIILDTVDSSYDYLDLYKTSDLYAPFASEPDNVTYKIKTYGMMTHGSTALTAPEDDGDLTSTMTITRTFTNGTGGNMDISEFGCTFRFYNTDNSNYYYYTLGIHDVRSAVTIPNGQELTLTYTFSCEA